MTVDCECGARWSGTKAEHCTACHQTFSGSATGDKHRVGHHETSAGVTRRRCLTVTEMTELRTKAGTLVLRPVPNAFGTVVWRRWDAEKRPPQLSDKESVA